ncbi:MAG: MBL fold metallo-hydrolase [Bacteroides sp.]
MKQLALILAMCLQVTFVVAQQVFENKDLSISKLKENVWVVETTDKTTMYILEGTRRALLIDTGTQCDELDKVVRRITDKPLDVVLTHVHPDHAGNIYYFNTIYMHPADTLLLHPDKATGMPDYPYKGEVRYLKDGQLFDLGGMQIEVVHTPGHTPGSICLLNRATGDCYSGDAFGSGQLWMQLKPHVPMAVYLKSCERMEKLMNEEGIKYLWCGHYPYVKNYFDLSYILKMKKLATRLIAGDQDGAKPFHISVPEMDRKGTYRILSDAPAEIVYNADCIN